MNEEKKPCQEPLGKTRWWNLTKELHLLVVQEVRDNNNNSFNYYEGKNI